MNQKLFETSHQDRLKALIEQGKKSSLGLHLEELQVEGYERVLKVVHKASHLTAIIALHNLLLGPGLGGVRIYPYASFDQALEDVLRLSKGMTYKSALADVGFGGAKSVIIAGPDQKKNKEYLLAFGEAVEQLGGSYICAEDVGCGPLDVAVIHSVTRYVVGVPHEKSSGDPSRFTAWGVYRGIQSVCKKLYGTDHLIGRRVAIQGLGQVGGHLADFLFWAGAHLIVSDIDSSKTKRFVTQYGATEVPVDQILKTECDILAPCGMGGILNETTIPELRCQAIAGAANNQLLKDSDAEAIMQKGILYAPDFVINAGGLLNVAEELEAEGYQSKFAHAKIHKIYETLLAIYEIAEKNQESTHSAAVALAEYRLKYAIGRRLTPPVFHHSRLT